MAAVVREQHRHMVCWEWQQSASRPSCESSQELAACPDQHRVRCGHSRRIPRVAQPLAPPPQLPSASGALFRCTEENCRLRKEAGRRAPRGKALEAGGRLSALRLVEGGLQEHVVGTLVDGLENSLRGWLTAVQRCERRPSRAVVPLRPYVALARRHCRRPFEVGLQQSAERRRGLLSLHQVHQVSGDLRRSLSCCRPPRGSGLGRRPGRERPLPRPLLSRGLRAGGRRPRRRGGPRNFAGAARGRRALGPERWRLVPHACVGRRGPGRSRGSTLRSAGLRRVGATSAGGRAAPVRRHPRSGRRRHGAGDRLPGPGRLRRRRGRKPGHVRHARV